MTFLTLFYTSIFGYSLVVCLSVNLSASSNTVLIVRPANFLMSLKVIVYRLWIQYEFFFKLILTKAVDISETGLQFGIEEKEYCNQSLSFRKYLWFFTKRIHYHINLDRNTNKDCIPARISLQKLFEWSPKCRWLLREIH